MPRKHNTKHHRSPSNYRRRVEEGTATGRMMLDPKLSDGRLASHRPR